MGLVCRAAAVALAVVLASAAVLPAQQPFKTSVQTVVVFATVRDGTGRLIMDLPQSAFTVLDNGKPVNITAFSSEIQPLTVALLLDMSASMQHSFLRVRESTEHFINALRPEDRVRIGSFGAEISLSPILTSDKATLIRIAREELWPGGGTPMWNAIFAGMDSLADESGRRVILVLTDGEDSGPLKGWKGSFGDVKQRAARDSFMIYAIGLEDEVEFGQPDRAQNNMTQLAVSTGGAHFAVGRGDDLKAAFTKVADELRRQYLLGFVPVALDGKEHTIAVRVDRPELTARARQTYVAGRR
jgi:Ca-activated chloride channel homolog